MGSTATQLAAIGLDVGSVNVRGGLLSGEGRVLWTGSRPLGGRVLDALRALLDDLARSGALSPEQPLRVRVVGVGRERVAAALCVETVNEVVALAEAAVRLAPSARSIIEVGGHTSRWVAVDAGGDVESFGLSEPCAAGTGAFIEQQAARLDLDASGLAAAALRAVRGVPVAGRCSVFAKSDMIHLQQKGIPVEEIAYGLCLAVARNIVSTLLRGQRMPTPIVLVGGGARNGGLRRALAEVLGHDVEVPPEAPSFAALGAAAVAARTEGQVTLARVTGALERAVPHRGSGVTHPALETPPADARGRPEPRFGEGQEARRNIQGYLGVDVGSVSTNLVVLDREGEVIDGVYLPTRGRPVEVLAEGLRQLRHRFGARLRVLGLGTTGSGRHLAAGLLGADVVKNEISCQLLSALRYFPDADTVIEIGGQDSKFIRAEGGRLVDFTMNKICAAGTGSFLEEEARRLGVPIVGEFARLALSRAPRPTDLGCRCTVFMDTEVVNALARGEEVADLCAGLAYAIARNYLERVVERRPIGRRVVMQGGVASNGAVVAAFSQLLDRPVQVHPLGRISGAIGAALVAREPGARGVTAFRGLDALESGRAPAVQVFECRRCENRCQVSRIVIPGSDGRAPSRAHFGDACERYAAEDYARGREGRSPAARRSGAANDAARAPSEVPDLFAAREELMLSTPTVGKTPATRRPTLGLPRASVLLGQLPFFRTLLSELGFEVRLSPPSSVATLELGAARLPAETCLPIKLTFGHVQQLLEDPGVDGVLVPMLGRVTDWNGDASLLCPYTHTLSHMLAASLERDRLLTPEMDLAEDEIGPMAAALAPHLRRFGVTARGGEGRSPAARWSGATKDTARIERALARATRAQRRVAGALRARGAEALAEHRRSGRGPALAVLGRPYTLGDPYLNLNLARHLRRLGLLALPMEMLPGADLELGPLPWRFNRDTLRALRWVMDQDDLYPVVLSSFGCGPDAFASNHVRRLRGDRPTLELELDEHRAEAGLITRLEAFLDEIAQHGGGRSRALRAPFLGHPPLRERSHYTGRRVWIPFMSDHAHAYAGAFRFGGLDARVLPPPDDELMASAEAVGTGKECHPYRVLLADLDRLAGRHRRGDLFYISGSTLPCLIQQYGKGMEALLEERGVRDLELLSPTMPGYWDLLGFEGYFRLYCGLFAVDLLTRAACTLRPYERSPGLTDALHALNLRDLQDALAGGDVKAALERCTARLDAVERLPGSRPLVGVAGDIYTRINPAANHDLFAWLERQGCEVWPAPFLVDLVEYGLMEGVLSAFRGRQLRQLLYQGFVLAGQQVGNWFVRRGLGSPGLVLPWGNRWTEVEARWREEPPLEVFSELARPYVGRRGNSLVRWNVAKMVDFARRGAHGVINAVGQNCMVGTASAAIMGRIRAEHGGIPMVTLYYGSTPTAALRAALEAFVHQVRGYTPRPPREPAPGGLGALRPAHHTSCSPPHPDHTA
jgi:predicted CoA-substrate-specific enzyme activase